MRLGGLHRVDVVSLAVAAAAVLGAYALKYHYSVASADDLGWVLVPTATLVETFVGQPFTYEAGVGFVNRELQFAIATSCAGINFFIIAFCMLTLGLVWELESIRRKVLLLPIALLCVYGATLLVNSARIAIAIALRAGGTVGASAAIHRLEGVAVYFVALCALFVFARAVLRRGSRWTLAWPVACYLCGALIVPLVNGAWREPSFWSHAVTVISATFALIGVIWLATRRRLRWLPMR